MTVIKNFIFINFHSQQFLTALETRNTLIRPITAAVVSTQSRIRYSKGTAARCVA